MKPVKNYRFVKWPFQRWFAKLLLCKITQWPCSLCPIPQFRLLRVRTSYICNISWPPWVLDPITNPSLGGSLAAPCYREGSCSFWKYHGVYPPWPPSIITCDVNFHNDGIRKSGVVLWSFFPLSLITLDRTGFCRLPTSLNMVISIT